jgi:hypothetical protein
LSFGSVSENTFSGSCLAGQQILLQLDPRYVARESTDGLTLVFQQLEDGLQFRVQGVCGQGTSDVERQAFELSGGQQALLGAQCIRKR